MGLLVAQLQNIAGIGQGSDDPLFDVLVILQQFDGQETGRVGLTDAAVLADFFLHQVDAAFQFRSVIDVDVADERLRSDITGFFSVATVAVVFYVGIVPFP